jgi:hypothetical protein
VLATCPSLPEVTTFAEGDADALAHAVGTIEEVQIGGAGSRASRRGWSPGLEMIEYFGFVLPK